MSAFPAYPQNRGMQNFSDPYGGQYAGQQYGTNFNGGYQPTGAYYGPQVPPPAQYQQPQPAAQEPNGLPTIDGVAWIQGGEVTAKAVNVNPGKTVMLIDSEPDQNGNNLFFLKSADQNGRPKPLQVFRYEEYNPTPAQVPADYVTRSEFDKLKEAFDSLAERANFGDGEEEGE